MLRATTSFHVGDVLVEANALIGDHDEIVVGREHLFEAVAGTGDGDALAELQSALDAAVATNADLEAKVAELQSALDEATAPAPVKQPAAKAKV